MNTGAHPIEGGDYEHGGLATRALKDMLKKLGVAADDVRRAVIAAYEAEMNVVIHARRGELSYALEPDQLDVAVLDQGPGIADVDLAMREGYSTAPLRARELGFGAGLGLPNIRKNSDWMEIRSTPGQGTAVRFRIRFGRLSGGGRRRHSIRTQAAACSGCMRCLHVCPTAAVRVHRGAPAILEHLCIDCSACIETCRAGALTMEGQNAELKTQFDQALLAVPAAFFTEFGPHVSPQSVLAALHRLGFEQVWIMDAWEAALRQAVVKFAQEEARAFPVIAPMCPAVLNLIAIRFPALLEHVAPFRFPLEALLPELAGARAVVMAECPACYTILRDHGGGDTLEIITPFGLRQAVFPLVVSGDEAAAGVHGTAGARAPEPRGVMQVTNVHHDVALLEKMENGLLSDIRVLELFACDSGCFGSPLLHEDAFIGRTRWRKAHLECRAPARAIRRAEPLRAQSGLRLDRSIARAMAKLTEIEELVRQLPGRDCGICGAPTCGAMAEDIVLGRAVRDECVCLTRPQETTT